MTSIEWLIKEVNSDCLNSAFIRPDLIEKAKEMHKIELGKTWDAALDADENRSWNVMRSYSDFDEYYNETYKK